MPESFRFPKPIPRDTTEKIAVAMTENMRSLEVWLNSILVPEAEGAADDHDELTNVTTSQHHARYTDGEAVAAVGAGGSYLPLAGGTMTGHIVLDANVPATIQIVENGRWALLDHAGSGVFSWSDVSGDFSFAGIATPGTSLRWDDSDNRWEFRDSPTVGAEQLIVADGTIPMTGDLDMGGNTIDDTTGQMVSVYLTSVQSCANNTFVKVDWDVVEFAAGGGGGWDDVGGANPSRITVEQAGVYSIVMQAYWDLTAGDNAQIRLYINGVSTRWGLREGVDDGFHRHQASAIVKLAASDYVEMWVRQSSGAAADLRTTGTAMSVARVA